MRNYYKYVNLSFKDHPQVDQFGFVPVGGGWVYAVRFGDMVKLGKTHNPSNRMSTLQTEQKVSFDEVHFIVCDDTAAAERGLLSRFSACRLQGEWFRLSHIQTEVIRAIREYKNGKFN